MIEAEGVRCWMCGKDTLEANGLTRVNEIGVTGIWACFDHLQRIPCQIKGCEKHRKGRYPQQWICREHWQAIPRAHKRVFFLTKRRMKRYEGVEELRAEYDRHSRLNFEIWRRLIDRTNAKLADGHIDVAEIHRMFGLDD